MLPTINRTIPITFNIISGLVPSTNAATINNINATMSIKAPIHLNTPCFSNIFFILYLLTYDYNTQIKEKKVFSYFFHIKLSAKT